jgi:hypothetical protein
MTTAGDSDKQGMRKITLDLSAQLSTGQSSAYSYIYPRIIFRSVFALSFLHNFLAVGPTTVANHFPAGRHGFISCDQHPSSTLSRDSFQDEILY